MGHPISPVHTTTARDRASGWLQVSTRAGSRPRVDPIRASGRMVVVGLVHELSGRPGVVGVACGRAAKRRSDLAPLSAESWVMPGSAAETRADACRLSGAATLPVQVPLRYWFVGGSAVAVS